MKVGVAAAYPRRFACLLIRFSLAIVFYLLLTVFPGSRGIATADNSAPRQGAEYGIDHTSFQVHKGTLKKNQNLSKILRTHNVSFSVIDDVAKKSKKIFDVRKMIAGNPYSVYRRTGGEKSVRYFVYERNPLDYVIYDLRDPVKVYTGTKPVDVKVRQVSGIIRSSLYRAFSKQGLDQKLAQRLSDLYAWTIDFHHLAKGDYFKIIYEENYAAGVLVGVGKILAANFFHQDRNYYGFYHEQDGMGAYYDKNGESLEKAFLKAPLKYTRITSRPSSRRVHPILKVRKKHLGTDYAAPHGTRVLSVGDGVVVKKGYDRRAGKHLTIRHSRVYKSQYLHLSKFAKGIRTGKTVKRGSVIGYVGKTGLATGPHLDFRFWKNKRVVNLLKEPMPAGKAIASTERSAFNTHSRNLADRLDAMVLQDTINLAKNE